MDTRKLIEVNSDSGGNKPEWKAGVPQNQQCEETRGNELSHSFFFFYLVLIALIYGFTLPTFTKNRWAEWNKPQLLSAELTGRHHFSRGNRTLSLPGAESRSFRTDAVLHGISIAVKASCSILLTSFYSRIQQRWPCQPPDLKLETFLGEETFQSIITTQNPYHTLSESWDYRWSLVNNC